MSAAPLRDARGRFASRGASFVAAPADPELAVILADLDRMAHAFDLDREGLGEVALDLAAEGILQGMDSETDPNGVQWEPLSPAYEEEKARISPGSPMAVLHGLMKTESEVRGVRVVAPDRATMEYGTNSDTRAEATWFQEGDGGSQPERPFYGLSAETIGRLDHLFDARLDSSMHGP